PLRRRGGLSAGAGGPGPPVPRPRRAGGDGAPGAARADLAGADAEPRPCRRPGGRAAPPGWGDPGADAAGAGGGAGAADHPPAAAPGARRPTLERPLHPGRAGDAGGPAGTGSPPAAGHVSSPRRAAAGSSAAYRAPRVATAWAL